MPLAQVADVGVEKGPPSIKSENARRTAWIYVDLTTSDMGGYVRRAQQAVEREVRLPAGVSLVWSGQYEYMQQANRRLRVVVPLTLALIVLPAIYLLWKKLELRRRPASAEVPSR